MFTFLLLGVSVDGMINNLSKLVVLPSGLIHGGGYPKFASFIPYVC